MSQLNLQFEAEPGADSAALSSAVESRLRKMPSVTEVEVIPSKQRLIGGGVGEVVAVLAAGVLIAKGSRELLVEVRALIPQIKGLLADIKGLRGAYVEVEGKRVAIDKVTDDQLVKAIEG